MNWDEAERRIVNGDDPEKVRECVYLRAAEIGERLAWPKGRPARPWLYPMFCFAACTGARRSEIVRVMPADLDLDADAVTIREKKQNNAFLTDASRRVRFVYVPKHTSWGNQVEIWFRVLARRVLRRGNVRSGADLREKILARTAYDNRTRATPDKWTDAGGPLHV